jgi:hypothetical protein
VHRKVVASGSQVHCRFRRYTQVPQMIERYGMQAALDVNNIGNAFTLHRSCDPLSVYQTGTMMDAEVLLVSHARVTLHTFRREADSILQKCLSTRAKAAMGLAWNIDLEHREGNAANLVAFGTAGGT